ncbi:MAG: hypothetical protein ACK52I_06610 [Pseudomonadota bacterium]|jgi:hypothetical protein
MSLSKAMQELEEQHDLIRQKLRSAFNDKSRLIAELAASQKECAALRKFSLTMIRESWKSEGVDGEFVQTEAVKFGLLKEETMQKACGDNCGCAEYGEFPLNCYRLTPLAKVDAP